MNLLLDTHVLLWWLDDYPRLSVKARQEISDGKNTVFVSAVTICEIRIKEALGKLDLPQNIRQVLEIQPFESLPVTIGHAYALAGLPDIHRDPFDRMLVAQAMAESFILVSQDRNIHRYSVPVLW